MDPLHSLMGVKTLHVVAGFFGGLVRALVYSEKSWVELLVPSIVGALVSAYFTPIVWPLITRYTSAVEGVEGSAAFFLGLCGLSISEGIIKAARKWRDNPSWPKFK